MADQYPFGVNALSEMLRIYQAPDEWVIVVDIDEFIEFPRPVGEVVAAADAAGANVVQAIMYDRFCTDGKPRGFDAGLRSSIPLSSENSIYKVCDGRRRLEGSFN